MAALDKLETLSDAFTSNADLNATETFDDNGTRTLTYTDPVTNMIVKSASYDSSGGKIADAHYENGVLVDSGTYDPATNKKLTDSHYDNGVLTQTDTLDADGKVVKIDRFAQTGIKLSTETIDYDASGGRTETYKMPTRFGDMTARIDTYGSDGKLSTALSVVQTALLI